MNINYVHTEIPELSAAFLDEGIVRIGSNPKARELRAMIEVALGTMDLAIRLGIRPPSSSELVSRAPLLSAMADKKMVYLRGWGEFDSCIKGFNSLGLMAEQVLNELRRLKAQTVGKQNQLKLEFISSRMDGDVPFYSGSDLENISEPEFLEIDDRDVAIWNCFAKRTIVCSTSSNMGISTHQALRLMQNVKLRFRGKDFNLLNKDEGSLIIWCPDERADFMNEEKTTFLRALEKDLPQITSLRTYINRQQRDPGALKDALLRGGYFFPTNPQSRDEIQNLIFIALNEIAKEQNNDVVEALKNENVRWALETLGCEVQCDRVVVHSGIESGIYGLLIPYILLLEQFLKLDLGRAVSVWNQASIGAALAGAVLADKLLRCADQWPDDIRSAFNSLFPSLSKFLDTQRLGKDLKTRIHGVFDIANLQSLAQRLGVVVENHLSGRGTAYVGLGSSSYSNGNRCVDILFESMSSEGAFQGKNALHPATHTLNPFAQALVFGEELSRTLQHRAVGAGLSQVTKPEPAGAAALAGYLLSRLDRQTLSIIEIAYCLKLMGFSQGTFLQFAGYGTADSQGLRTFLQSACEEGPLMEHFARNMLLLLSWSLPDLERSIRIEKKQSRMHYWLAPLDDIDFEYLDGPICIYLTGDNTAQVDPELVRMLAEACSQNLDRTKRFLEESEKSLPRKLSTPADLASLFFYRTAKKMSFLAARAETAGERWIHRRFSKNGALEHE